MRLQGKIAIVTGAATGIDKDIAIRFAREGATVVVDYAGKGDAPADDVNPTGPFLVSQAAACQMIKQGNGGALSMGAC